jgi:hypothetical protein
MKHKIFPLLVGICLIIGIGVGVFSVYKNTKSPESNDKVALNSKIHTKVPKGKVRVTIEVDLKRPQKKYKVLLNKDIDYKKDLNAFTALQKVAGEKVGYQNGATVYVYKIGKYSENNVHSGTGWKYYINNDDDIVKAANLKDLKTGDHLYWKFVDGY